MAVAVAVNPVADAPIMRVRNWVAITAARVATVKPANALSRRKAAGNQMPDRVMAVQKRVHGATMQAATGVRLLTVRMPHAVTDVAAIRAPLRAITVRRNRAQVASVVRSSALVEAGVAFRVVIANKKLAYAEEGLSAELVEASKARLEALLQSFETPFRPFDRLRAQGSTAPQDERMGLMTHRSPVLNA